MAVQKTFDPRKMMEHAVLVMRKSIAERREDGKKVPAVGAVLWKPNGSVETAFRGELRNGDHAEFALLERKNRANPLDGCVLFTTLEPCAPGARKFPKLSCAERITLARMKAVWIGIEDPDPTVDRKGIKYLQKHKVPVRMFDRDLQEQILKFNKEFVSQAEERAIGVEPAEPEPLIRLEESIPTAAFRDLSLKAVNQYRKTARIPEPTESVAFQRRLVHQGILVEKDGKLLPSGYGVLLFGETPRDIMPQAGLLATIRYPNGAEEPRDFDEPLVLIPDLLEKWLDQKLPQTIDRGQMRRRKLQDVPFEMVRETVVNALVHRDYEITGAKCQLTVTPETIEVRSPGGPVEPITLEQLQEFSAPMLSRNPVLHYVFARMGMAEERGLGLGSLAAGAREGGLPLPKFRWKPPYLVVTLFRTAEGVLRMVDKKTIAKLGQDEQGVLMQIVRGKASTTPQLMEATGLDERKTQRVLRNLLSMRLIRRVGSARAVRYEAPR
jgi:ATP-dependent DNA helicase RecG